MFQSNLTHEEMEYGVYDEEMEEECEAYYNAIDDAADKLMDDKNYK